MAEPICLRNPALPHTASVLVISEQLGLRRDARERVICGLAVCGAIDWGVAIVVILPIPPGGCVDADAEFWVEKLLPGPGGGSTHSNTEFLLGTLATMSSPLVTFTFCRRVIFCSAWLGTFDCRVPPELGHTSFFV